MCRKCETCRAARKRRWIGRLLAEETRADAVWFTTWTYGGGYDNPQAYFLRYRDMSLAFKRLRKAGYRFKHVTVGEYGTEKSRAHWHSILFFYGAVPDVPLGEHVWAADQPEKPKDAPTQDFWPHGFVQFEIPKSKRGCAVYLLDYLDKGQNADKKHAELQAPRMRCSNGIGRAYIEHYARDHAKAGLGLFQQGPRYTLPNNNNKDGKPFYYAIDRESADYTAALDAYLLEWARLRSAQRIPLNDELAEYLEAICQDTHLQPVEVQQYLERVYGFAPVNVPDLPTTSWMISPDWGLTHDQSFGLVTLNRFDQKGEIAWQATAPVASGDDVEKTALSVLRTRPQRVDRLPRYRSSSVMNQTDVLEDEHPPKSRSNTSPPRGSPRRPRSPVTSTRANLSRRPDVGTKPKTTARIMPQHANPDRPPSGKPAQKAGPVISSRGADDPSSSY